jgi:aryl-alcohol dehydrogenase-like predicted oxidoreductase
MTELPKRELGRTGLKVTMLGYGAMELRGAPRARDISEFQAETILNAVLDSGINYIDTSIDYGLSEERIGRYIGHRRDEYYLASTCQACRTCVYFRESSRRGATFDTRAHAAFASSVNSIRSSLQVRKRPLALMCSSAYALAN